MAAWKHPGGTISVTYQDARNGEGNPATVTDQATTFTPFQVTESNPLPAGVVNTPYSETLTATGGVGAYTWSLPAANTYTESSPGSNWIDGGVAQGWNAEGGDWSLALPWAFPYYGKAYTSVNVSSNGYLDFTSTATDFQGSNSQALLESSVRIAPFWANLAAIASEGDDIYVTSNPNYVAVRWQTHVWGSSEYAVNFEAVLYPNGNVEFNYGLCAYGIYSTVGVSAGDGVHYTLSRYNNNFNISPVPPRC